MRKLIIFIVAVTAAFVGAQASTLTQEADSAYSSEDYSSAVQLYQQALQQEGVSPLLYYNLGNAYYRLGKLGKAVANYQRALALDPSMTDARSNLDFVNTKILDKPEDDSTFLGNMHDGIKSWMSPNAWAWTAFGMFLVLLGCIAIYIFSSNVLARKSGFFGGFVVLCLFIYAFVAAAQVSSAPFRHDRAVVIVPTTNMSTSPGSNAGKNAKIVPIHEGTTVQIIDSITIPGESVSPLWYDVKINNATRAWVQSADVEKI